MWDFMHHFDLKKEQLEIEVFMSAFHYLEHGFKCDCEIYPVKKLVNMYLKFKNKVECIYSCDFLQIDQMSDSIFQEMFHKKTDNTISDFFLC